MPSIALAISFDFTISPNPNSELVYGCDSLACKGFIDVIITNNNQFCSIERCSIYQNGEHRLDSTNIAAKQSKKLNDIWVRIPASNPASGSIELHCKETTSTIPYCDGSTQQKTHYATFNNVKYCGDNLCDRDSPGYEDCNSCIADCGCLTNEYCDDGNCKSKCGNSQIDAGETCDGSNKPSCESLGFDHGETSCSSCNLDKSNCCKDECSVDECDGNGFKKCVTDANCCKKWSSITPCTENEACSNGKCVDITTDEHCGSIETKCSSNEYCENKACKNKCGNGRCDSGETCVNDRCCNGKSVDFSSDKANCGTCSNDCGILDCINGKCIGSTKGVNEKCTDDSQCHSDLLCYKEVCQSGVSIKLGTKLSSLQVGKEMDIGLSIINMIEEDISVQLIIVTASGMSVSGSQGAASGSSNQFTAFDGVMSRGEKSITLRIGASEPGTKKLEAKGTYNLSGKVKEFYYEKEIVFYEEDGKEIPSSTEGKSSESTNEIYSLIKSLLDWIKNIFR